MSGQRRSACRAGMICILVAVVHVFLPGAAAQPQPVPRTPEPDLTAIEETLSGVVKSGSLQGVSLLLVQDGQVLFRKAYGNLTPDSRVRIASSTKPIAAFGILLLVDDGKLSLDDTVGDMLPEFRGTPVEKATVRQLLSHQAGIKGSYPEGRPTKGSLADFSELIARRGSLENPGNFNYSGVSIDIACRVAEVAAGVPIEDHLKSRVWQPLEMRDSEFDIAATPGTVSSAERARGEGRYVSCGGGMKSTLDDMANFYQMLLDGGVYRGKRLLSKALYEDMIARHGRNPNKLNDPYTTGEYGYGIYRDRVAPNGEPLTISHGGALGTMPWADLDTGLVGIFFSQTPLGRVKPLIAEVQAEARGEEAAPAVISAGSPRGGASRQQRTPRQSSGRGGRSPEKAFERISGGADVISLEQFRDFFENSSSNSRLRDNPEFVERLFKRLDENNDGVVTQEEYGKLQSMRR